ncbi:MAG: hypothetical protein NWE99_06005 [Candidatus Bathyarchaeota archaeon]|nr:hypothetical protein [Candidatus Bathyarchaeota archaeon]
MRPLVVIYLLRIVLAVVAALISTMVATMLEALSLTTFIDGLTIALLVYLLSYYVIKAKYLKKVEKPSKIMTTGIFMYFLLWAVFFILFYTIVKGPAV